MAKKILFSSHKMAQLPILSAKSPSLYTEFLQKFFKKISTFSCRIFSDSFGKNHFPDNTRESRAITAIKFSQYFFASEI